MVDRAPAPGGLELVRALVNTLDLRAGTDSLDTPPGRADFGLTEDTAAARELRESLRAALLAHAGHPPHRAVTPLGTLLAAAPLVVAVDPADGSAALVPAERVPGAGTRGAAAPGAGARAVGARGAGEGRDAVRGAPPADAPAGEGALLARVAEAVAGALVEGTWTRLKACEADDCHWAYYDRSPAGRGRWCSMRGCGSRAKMRRYRAKEG
ncbi:CGNR zinc finger domain-containing protein [Streptomyces sp. NPDC052077]|uniref:CGNR zinc finger domain-containing protein n=1 Tax=Streptomyces sp. NPDC052077 TaxID=3154757 RepID=UPI003429851A